MSIWSIQTIFKIRTAFLNFLSNSSVFTHRDESEFGNKLKAGKSIKIKNNRLQKKRPGQ